MKTHDELAAIVKELRAAYKAELDMLPIKPKERDILLVGFTDGVRTALFHTAKVLVQFNV